MNNQIVSYLLKIKYITKEQLDTCLSIQAYYQQQKQNVSLCQILVREKMISQEKLQHLMHNQVTMISQSHPQASLPPKTSSLSQISLQDQSHSKLQYPSEKQTNSQLRPDLCSQNSSSSQTKIQSSTKQQNFGRYVIKDRLGEGGMGVVYRAFDSHLKIDVALKLINNGLTTEKQKERFKREAAMMANLNHPYIVRIFESGKINRRQFITMEIVEGKELGEYLKTLNLLKLINIMIDICDAVHFGHTKGVIHRDLKPANIMLDKNLLPKVMDFGLAKQMGQEKLSHTGEGVGTPLYMSPEQMGGEKVDARADVYSLGIILYEIMTDRTPFIGEKQNIQFEILMSDPTPPSDFDKGLSRDLEAICLKAIEKKKHKRYKTANNFSRDLKNYIQGNSVSAKPFTTQTRISRWLAKRRISIAVLFIMSILLCVLVYQWRMTNVAKDKILKSEQAEINAEINAYEKSLTSELILARLYSESLKYQKMKIKLNSINKELKEKEKKIKKILEKKKHLFFKKMREKYLIKKKLVNSTINVCKKYFNINFYEEEEEVISKPEETSYFPHQPSSKWKLDSDKDLNTYFWKMNKKEHSRKICKNKSPKMCKKKHFYWKRNGIFKNLKSCVYAISPSNKYIATFDTKLRIWRNQNGNIRKLNINTNSIKAPLLLLRFSPDDRWLFVCTRTLYLLINIIKNKQHIIVDGKKNTKDIDVSLKCVAFSSDSKQMACGYLGGIKLYDLDTFNKKAFPKEKATITTPATSLCFGTNKLFTGYFDINVFNISSNSKNKKWNLTKDVTLYDAHQSNIVHLELNKKKTFLLSYSKEGRLQIRNTGNYRKVQEVEFHKTTRMIKPFFKESIEWGIWKQNRCFIYSKKDTIRELSLPQGPNYIPIPLFKELAKQFYKDKRMKIILERNSKNYFTSFSHDNHHLIHYAFPFLYVFDTINNKLKMFFLFNKKKLQLYMLDKAKIVKNYLITTSDGYYMGNLGKAHASIVVWNLATEKIVFSKTYLGNMKVKNTLAFNPSLTPIQKKSTLNVGQIFVKKGTKITVENLLLSKKGGELVPAGKFKLNSRFGKFKISFYKNKIAFVGVGDEINAKKRIEIIEKKEGKYHWIREFEIDGGRITKIKFLKKNVIAIGTLTGRVWIQYLKEKISKKFDFYRTIKNIFYNSKNDLLFVSTNVGVNIQPLGYDDRSNIYPIKLFQNYKNIGVGISSDFKKIALSLVNGHTFLIDIDKK